MHEAVDGGYETASSNSEVTAIGNELSGHVTVGASLKLPGSTLDYVASPTQHRMSVSFKF